MPLQYRLRCQPHRKMLCRASKIAKNSLMPTAEAPTPAQIRAYCTEHASSIYVPVKRGGRFTQAALTELSPAERRGLIDRWCVNRFLPHRILARAAGEDLPPAA